MEVNSTIQYNAPYPFSLNAPLFVAKDSVSTLTVHYKNGSSSSLQNKIGFIHVNELYFSNWSLIDDGNIIQLEVEAYGTVSGKNEKKSFVSTFISFIFSFIFSFLFFFF
jgi:hypothetical protein